MLTSFGRQEKIGKLYANLTSQVFYLDLRDLARRVNCKNSMCYLDLMLEGGEGGADGEQDEQHEEQQKGDCHLGEGIMRIREMEMMSTRRATAK